MKSRTVVGLIVSVIIASGSVPLVIGQVCNGQKYCYDAGNQGNGCTVGSSCGWAQFSPDPCISCITGNCHTDDCTVTRWQTGSVTIYDNGVCLYDSLLGTTYCTGGTPEDPQPNSCAAETDGSANCTDGCPG